MYPSEYDDMKAKITELELELAIQKSKNDDLKEQIQLKNSNNNYNQILDKLTIIERKLDSLDK